MRKGIAINKASKKFIKENYLFPIICNPITNIITPLAVQSPVSSLK